MICMKTCFLGGYGCTKRNKTLLLATAANKDCEGGRWAVTGIEFNLEKIWDQVRRYGRGPFECYPDRKAAAHVGVYEQSVGDLHVPHIVPGECSGRTDVRWVTFRNKDGFGIYASRYGTSPPMQMSASYYSTSELDRATHDEELVEGDNIEVHLDHKHMGLGGDDSWTPCVHQQYLVPAIPYSFSVRLCPVTPAASDHEVYKSQQNFRGILIRE